MIFMSMGTFVGIDIERAAEDLNKRTLAKLPGDIARLLYLAGTRDCSTGRYYHDGLAFHFTEKVTGLALAYCHREIFRRLAFSSLEELVRQLEMYVQSTHEQPEVILGTWRKLESYRVTVPLDCDPLDAQLFSSNIKIAVAVLQSDPQNNSRG